MAWQTTPLIGQFGTAGSGLNPLVDGGFNGLHDVLENSHTGRALVIGGHGVPRCVICAGLAQHVGSGAVVFTPLIAVTPILIGDFVLLEGQLSACLESSQLLVRGDRQPKLDDQDAMLA